jgi:hypothetical protein
MAIRLDYPPFTYTSSLSSLVNNSLHLQASSISTFSLFFYLLAVMKRWLLQGDFLKQEPDVQLFAKMIL